MDSQSKMKLMENEISGIILDSQERGRSSRYIKLLSPNGAISVLAPRSMQVSQWTDLTQPLHRVRYWVVENAQGIKLKEGVVDERFEHIRLNFQRIESAQSMRLVALKMIRPGLACQEFYQTFYAHLRALNDPAFNHICAKAILASFLVKTLVHEGLFDLHSPISCDVCEKSLSSMSLGFGARWFCALHVPSKGAHFVEEALQEAMRSLAQNRRLSALADFKEIGLCSILMETIKGL